MLAIYEIQYKEIPFKVVINEVVELAKKYGEDTSASFINGVLANVVKELSIHHLLFCFLYNILSLLLKLLYIPLFYT